MQDRTANLAWAHDLTTLTLTQTMAIVPLVSDEAARQTVRDLLLHNLRQQFPAASTKAAARKLAAALAEPGDGRHGDILRTINSLSRGGAILRADTIERILARCDREAEYRNVD